jgi:YesN/AraC family two-component response regulator
MPDMTGLVLINKTKELFPNCKTIMTSAYSPNELAIDDSNIDDYVSKPWELKLLKEKLQ